MCAGFDYIHLIDGGVGALMFFRTKAWDHAPGAAMVRECGSAAKRSDGSKYTPASQGGPLMLAREETWAEVRDTVAA
jgi:fructose-1,6-bisphosphatase/inositol monophosphatase family enzyme